MSNDNLEALLYQLISEIRKRRSYHEQEMKRLDAPPQTGTVKQAFQRTLFWHHFNQADYLVRLHNQVQQYLRDNNKGE